MIGKKAALFFLVFFIVVRLIWINADPFWLKHYSDIHDETWWADNARLMILFGQWQMDEFAGAWAVSPIGTWLHYLSFSIAGINFMSLRFWSVISGLISIALIYRLSVKNQFNNPILITAAFTGFQTWLLWNRMGHWESTLGMLLLVIYAMLFYKSNFYKIAGAACLATIAVFIKPTFIYLAVPVFGYFLLSNHQVLKTKAKQLVAIFLPAFLIALGFKLFYFDLNQQQFQSYYQHFQAIYYTWFDLINPINFTTKLAGIFRNEFFVQPDVALAVLVLLICKTDNQKLNQLRWLMGLIFIGLMFSDFNSRRFIPLLPLLAFYVVASFQQLKISFNQLDGFQKLVLFIFSIAAIGLFTQNPIWLLVLSALVLVFIFFINQLQSLFIKTGLILIALLIVCASGNYCNQQWSHFEKPVIEFSIKTISESWLWIFILLISFYSILIRFRLWGLMVFFSFFSLLSFLKINFSIQDVNNGLATKLNGAVVGDLFSFEAAFQSKSYMLHYAIDSISNEIRAKQKMKFPQSVVFSNFSEFQTVDGMHKSFKNFSIQPTAIYEVWPIYDHSFSVGYFNLKTETEPKTEDIPK